MLNEIQCNFDLFVEHEKYKQNINRELLVLLFDIALTVM